MTAVAALASKIRDVVCTRHGPAPSCELKIEAYEQGRSEVYEDKFKMQRFANAARSLRRACDDR